MKTIFVFKSILLLIWIFNPNHSRAQLNAFSNLYRPGSKLYVHALQGLSLRANPDLKAQSIMIIPLGAEVEVMPDSKSKVAITNSNIQGTWAKVKYGTNTDGKRSFSGMPFQINTAISFKSF